MTGAGCYLLPMRALIRRFGLTVTCVLAVTACFLAIGAALLVVQVRQGGLQVALNQIDVYVYRRPIRFESCIYVGLTGIHLGLPIKDNGQVRC